MHVDIDAKNIINILEVMRDTEKIFCVNMQKIKRFKRSKFKTIYLTILSYNNQISNCCDYTSQEEFKNF